MSKNFKIKKSLACFQISLLLLEIFAFIIVIGATIVFESKLVSSQSLEDAISITATRKEVRSDSAVINKDYPSWMRFTKKDGEWYVIDNSYLSIWRLAGVMGYKGKSLKDYIFGGSYSGDEAMHIVLWGKGNLEESHNLVYEYKSEQTSDTSEPQKEPGFFSKMVDKIKSSFSSKPSENTDVNAPTEEDPGWIDKTKSFFFEKK